MLRKDLKKAFKTSSNPAEVAKFNATAAEWRNPNGAYRVVHAFNAARLAWLFAQLEKPGEGPQKILDVGCATGLVSEAFSRQGADVTGIDVSERNIAVATACAKNAGLNIAYRGITPEELAAEHPHAFDTVLALEVVEHVQNLDVFLDALFRCVKPGGAVVVATLNQTWRSWFIGIIMAEYVLGWLPKGTHAWASFVKPETLDAAAAQYNFKRAAQTGLTFNPLRWRWVACTSLAVNYMVVYRRQPAGVKKAV